MIDYREAAASFDIHNALLDKLCASYDFAMEAEQGGNEAVAAIVAELQLAHDDAFEFGRCISDGLLSHQGSFDDLVDFLRARDRNRLAIEQADKRLRKDPQSILRRAG